MVQTDSHDPSLVIDIALPLESCMQTLDFFCGNFVLAILCDSMRKSKLVFGFMLL
jgi:hypothetical protein